jgi:hypothetical protein
MGAEQAKALADYAGSVRDGVGGMVKGFQKDREAMAADLKKKSEALKESLAHGEADRMKDFKELKACIQEVLRGVEKSVKDIKTYVANKLEEFSGARADMSRELKNDLAKYVADVEKATRAVLDEARTRVDGFADERKVMSGDWRGMAAAMAEKKGVRPAAEAEPAAAEAEIEEAQPKKKARKKRAKK